MSKRVQFFVLAGFVCAALTPVAEDDVRFVPVALAIVYGVLALLSALDDAGRR